MKPLPIRLRLMAWYFSVLAFTFGLFAWVAFHEMRQSLLFAVDQELRGRVSGFQRLLAQEEPEHYQAELLQHGGSSDLFEMKDATGKWIYRSPDMEVYHIDAPDVPLNEFWIESTRMNGIPLRVLTSRIRIGGREYGVATAVSLVNYQNAVRRFGTAMLFSMPLLLFLGGAGGFWISRKALNPIDQITWEAQAINAQRLSRRLPVPNTKDELQRLSQTLNAMLERLEQSFAKITRFTADASHELRTPIAYMRTVADVALRNPRSEAEYKQALSDISAELQKTTVLIESLLLLARGDAGYSQPGERMDLRAAIDNASNQTKPFAESKQLKFERVVPGKPLWVTGDPQSLERMFLILLDNAVKYTPDGGTIQLFVGIADGHAIAEVRDTGIGIADTDRPLIFDRFYRADKARARESAGAGLGLSIALWIAQMHGGTITVATNLLQGSSFTVRLPLLKEN
jgi:heavy metal sensor kinase